MQFPQRISGCRKGPPNAYVHCQSPVSASLNIPKAPYLPSQRKDLPTATLTDLEKVYVGRSYDSGVDPFPEYSYGYSERSPSLDLEHLANKTNCSPCEDSFSWEFSPLTPSDATFSSIPVDKRAIAREAALSGSSLNLPPDNILGVKESPKANLALSAKGSAHRTTPSLARLSSARCRALLQTKYTFDTGLPPSQASVSRRPSVAVTGTSEPAPISTLPSPAKRTKPLRQPSSPSLSPPLPSMLTVSSVLRPNSLFSINLPEGYSTQMTLPSYTSILADTSSTSVSTPKASGIVNQRLCTWVVAVLKRMIGNFKKWFASQRPVAAVGLVL